MGAANFAASYLRTALALLATCLISILNLNSSPIFIPTNGF